jgi:membrane associated rhomboid family serine protease
VDDGQGDGPTPGGGYPRPQSAVTEPDLFVICKNCSAEVSPYVTECPYCGQRVRKRAPKIDRTATDAEPRQRRPRAPSLPRLRRDEIPGIAPETRPYATGALIAVAVALFVVGNVPDVDPAQIGTLTPFDSDWWRVVTTPFVHLDNAGYAFVALLTVGIFGMHLERRFGWLAPVAVFLLSGAAGAALAKAVLEPLPADGILGANGAALGMLCAWLVDDRRAHARGDDRGNDLLGVYVLAAVLFLLSVAEPSANLVAAAGGAAAGAVCGLALTTFRR